MTQIYCDPHLPAQWQERERQLHAQRQAEESMREREAPPAANAEPLRSISLARVRLDIERFYGAYGRRREQPPKDVA